MARITAGAVVSYRGYCGPSAYFGPAYYYAPPVVYSAPPTGVYTTPAPVYVTPPATAVPQNVLCRPSQPQNPTLPQHRRLTILRLRRKLIITAGNGTGASYWSATRIAVSGQAEVLRREIVAVRLMKRIGAIASG